RPAIHEFPCTSQQAVEGRPSPAKAQMRRRLYPDAYGVKPAVLSRRRNRTTTAAMSPRIRLAVDIGGTFTDLVLALPGRTLSAKRLTTPDAPDRAVIEGVAAILREAGIGAGQLDLVIHGTTLATNALIERKGARTALITTRGFRDSLEIAYEHRFEQYDLYMERPAPLVERDLRLEVPERLAADGSLLLELDEAALDALVPVLRAQNIEAVAVSFLHSYVNPAHEERARER